jgi:hypothetical protein
MGKKNTKEPSTKPSYLLTTDEQTMQRWKGAASSHPSFAAFARSALDTAAVSGAEPQGRFIGVGLFAIGEPCYRNVHWSCDIAGCECSCHRMAEPAGG